MIIDVSYTADFEHKFDKLKKLLHAQELMDLDGIGSQTDLAAFSRQFFSKKGITTADVSIDSNANVDDMSVISFEVESSKPIHKLNSYFLLYKYGKALFDEKTAERMLEAQFTKDIYINDFYAFNKPYSYHPHTSIVVIINGSLKYLTMESLFKNYGRIVDEGDREVVYFNDSVSILDKNNNFVDLKCVLRHKTDKKIIEIETKNGLCTIVTSDHPVILENGKEILAGNLKIGDRLLESTSILPLIAKPHYSDIERRNPYLIGFWLGDGSAVNNTVTFYQKDIENNIIFDLIKKDCKEHDSTFKILEDRKVIIYSKDSFEYFSEMGRLSHERKLPECILGWERKRVIELLCGLIDAEGTIQPTGSVNIRVNSFALIQQVTELLRVLGCKNIRSSFMGKPQSKNGFTTNKEMYRVSFRIPCELIEIFSSYSLKINEKEDIVSQRINKDGRWETNEVYKMKEYDDEIGYVYDVTTVTGTFHCQGMTQHNCFNFSCIDVMFMGLPFVKKIKSSPPKNFISINGQLQQFINYASNSIAGAVGLADFLIVYSWYVDKLFEEWGVENQPSFLHYLVRQELQSTIFTVNQPFRGGIQSPFTNISIYDDIFLEKLCSEYYFPDGSQPNISTIKALQGMYLDIMNDTLSKTPVTFPVTTACFAVDDDKNILDKEFLRYICEKNQEYGFINIYCGATSTLSSCCRLRSDNTKEYFNQFGAGGTKIGSLGVVTLNLPRLAIKYGDNHIEFFVKLNELVELAAKINHVKRHIIQKRIDNGNLPLYTHGFMDTKKQYSTCGLTGINEVVEIMGENILEVSGQKLVNDILTSVNTINDGMEEFFGTPHNCEQVPAENSAIKLAQCDILLGYQEDYEVYSNQFIPLTTNADLLDRIKLQGMYDQHMTGGAICHLNVDSKIDKVEDMMVLIEYSAKAGVIYFAINYNLQKCENDHMSVGKATKCLICGSRITDNFTRVVGFLTNTKNWHSKRRQFDHPNRKWYSKI